MLPLVTPCLPHLVQQSPYTSSEVDACGPASCVSSVALSSDDFPARFTHGPSLGGHGGMPFAFVVRREPEHALARRERACPGTRGTCYQRDATVQKTRGFDGHHASKRAFGRFGGWMLGCHRIATSSMLVVSRGRRGHHF